MPRTYARNHRARGSLPMGAVDASQRQSEHPYRMHRPDPLVNGVSNLAAALFRAPIERAQIEDQRKAAGDARTRADSETAYRHSRDDKDDLFREKQLAQSHAEHESKTKATAGSKASGDAHMGTIPAMVHQSTIDPKTHKTTYSQRPLSDDEMTGVMHNRDRLKTTQDLGHGNNPSNGQPLGPGNAYEIKKPAELAAADDLFAQQHALKPAAAAPAADLFGPPAPAAGAPAQDPHAVDPALPPALAPQVTAISQAVAKLHPADQQAYGQIMAGVKAAHDAGDENAIAAATQKLQIANSRLLGQAPPPAPGPGHQPGRGLGVQPGMAPPSAPAGGPDPFALGGELGGAGY